MSPARFRTESRMKKASGRGLCRGDKARMLLVCPAMGRRLVPLPPNQQNCRQKHGSPDERFSQRRGSRPTPLAKHGYQDEQSHNSCSQLDYPDAPGALQPSVHQETPAFRDHSATGNSSRGAAQVAGTAQVRVPSKASNSLTQMKLPGVGRRLQLPGYYIGILPNVYSGHQP